MTDMKPLLEAAAHRVAEAETRVLRQAALLGDLASVGLETADTSDLLRVF